MGRATVGQIAALVEELAPRHWAEDWDNVGLLLGDPAMPVGRVLVALEATDAVVEEAAGQGAQLLLVHHPLIFRPLRSLRLDEPVGRRLTRLLTAGSALYAAHTNFDQAEGATNDTLAAAAGLTEWRVLQAVGEERYQKVVVFVPDGHLDPVRDAMAAAGAGATGRYSHCAFEVAGTGTFLPAAGTQPFIGLPGQLERVAERRLETIMPERLAGRVVAAMVAAHPYEEVAYDLYPLANPGKVRGHGRIGDLAAPLPLAELAARLKANLGVEGVRVVGQPDRQVQAVAVAAGAGGSLVREAAAQGAGVLVTGDIDYHDAQDALERGLCLIDPGHYGSEARAMEGLAAYLERRLAGQGSETSVLLARAGGDPFRWL